MAGRLRNSNLAFEQIGEQKFALLLANNEASIKDSWLIAMLKKLTGIEV